VIGCGSFPFFLNLGVFWILLLIQSQAACRATVGAHVKLSDQNSKANQSVSLTDAPSLEQADEILARFGYVDQAALATA